MRFYTVQLIAEIKSRPFSWDNYKGDGIIKDNIKVTGFGNSAIFSTICVHINDHQQQLGYWDRFNLERALNWWFNNVSLEKVSKQF